MKTGELYIYMNNEDHHYLIKQINVCVCSSLTSSPTILATSTG